VSVAIAARRIAPPERHVSRHDNLEIGAGIARFRPAGPSTLVSAVELIASVIAHCRENGIARLLVDTTALEGIAIPSLVDRFLMIEEWAREADGRVAVAVVARPEYMHPTKFGVQVATDMGMVFDVYATEAEATRWLAEVTTTFRS
jgi:hypothetical protein